MKAIYNNKGLQKSLYEKEYLDSFREKKKSR